LITAQGDKASALRKTSPFEIAESMRFEARSACKSVAPVRDQRGDRLPSERSITSPINKSSGSRAPDSSVRRRCSRNARRLGSSIFITCLSLNPAPLVDIYIANFRLKRKKTLPTSVNSPFVDV